MATFFCFACAIASIPFFTSFSASTAAPGGLLRILCIFLRDVMSPALPGIAVPSGPGISSIRRFRHFLGSLHLFCFSAPPGSRRDLSSSASVTVLLKLRLPLAENSPANERIISKRII
jgi:hypothetical protein